MVLQGYVTADVAEKEGLHKLNLSGTKFRKMLRAGGSCRCAAAASQPARRHTLLVAACLRCRPHSLASCAAARP